MYAIDRTDYGYKLTFSDSIKQDEMARWRDESERTLKRSRAKFGVMVDMRALKPLDSETQAVMVGGQQLYKQAGMERSAVILDNAITTLQFKRLAKESGIYAWERYINASVEPNWERTAEAWVKEGVDPDQ